MQLFALPCYTCTTRENATPRREPILLPEEIIPWLVERGLFPIDAEDELKEYWDHMESREVPHKGAAGMHPLFLWGDDAQCTEQDKLCVVSMGRVLESGKNALHYCWPLFVYQHAAGPTFNVMRSDTCMLPQR